MPPETTKVPKPAFVIELKDAGLIRNIRVDEVPINTFFTCERSGEGWSQKGRVFYCAFGDSGNVIIDTTNGMVLTFSGNAEIVDYRLRTAKLTVE